MELYIHIPFCVRKCHYCDFLSFAGDDTIREKYVQELLREIRKKAPDFSMSEITSIFVGGGTPTTLDSALIAEIMDCLREEFNIRSDAEISIECNPGTADYRKLCAMRDAGFNRLSIGLQSANDDELKTLGRIHNWNQFVECYRNALAAGFNNINVDIISAIPGQSVDSYKSTLKKVIELKPQHISAYSLIIEEGTLFYDRYNEALALRDKGKEQHLLPTEDDEREMYHLTKSMLKNAGYERYEVSNYSRPGKQCRHNMGYWLGDEYLGFGLGASSYIAGVRYKNTIRFEDYLKRDYQRYEEEKLDIKDRMSEYMMLRLRLTKGLAPEEFAQVFGEQITSVWPGIMEGLIADGLMEFRDGMYFVTESGFDLNNQLILPFI